MYIPVISNSLKKNPCKKHQQIHTHISHAQPMQARPTHNQPAKPAPRVVCHQPSSKDKIHSHVRHGQPRPKCHVSVPLAPLAGRKARGAFLNHGIFVWGVVQGMVMFFFRKRIHGKILRFSAVNGWFWEVFVSSRIYNVVYLYLHLPTKITHSV